MRFLSATALIVLFAPALHTVAQQHVPPAPDSTTAQPMQPAQEQPANTPSAPAPSAAPEFPKPDPANFTAASPTKEIVNAFLQANFGFDENRMWQVQAILKTPVNGYSKVIVLIGDKTGKVKQPQILSFITLPDGKHIVAGDEILAFGDHPFAGARQQLQERASGPYRGAASKDLELVEFADFQCPHCKEAQANMEKLAVDYPKARIVFENYPLPYHPEALNSGEYGVCVTRLGGSSAFFQFAAAVFDGQDGLATPDGATLTLNAAVVKAGLDPAKVAACAATPDVKANIDASVQLGKDLNINETPTLVVNGRAISANVPYDVLKKIIDYQIKVDGVSGQ